MICGSKRGWRLLDWKILSDSLRTGKKSDFSISFMLFREAGGDRLAVGQKEGVLEREEVEVFEIEIADSEHYAQLPEFSLPGKRNDLLQL